MDQVKQSGQFKYDLNYMISRGLSRRRMFRACFISTQAGVRIYQGIRIIKRRPIISLPHGLTPTLHTLPNHTPYKHPHPPLHPPHTHTPYTHTSHAQHTPQHTPHTAFHSSFLIVKNNTTKIKLLKKDNLDDPIHRLMDCLAAKRDKLWTPSFRWV